MQREGLTVTCEALERFEFLLVQLHQRTEGLFETSVVQALQKDVLFAAIADSMTEALSLTSYPQCVQPKLEDDATEFKTLADEFLLRWGHGVLKACYFSGCCRFSSKRDGTRQATRTEQRGCGKANSASSCTVAAVRAQAVKRAFCGNMTARASSSISALKACLALRASAR